MDFYTIMQVKQENIVPEIRIPQVCDDGNFEEVSLALKACLDGDPNKRMDSENLCQIMDRYHSKIDQSLMKSPLPKKRTRLTQELNSGSKVMRPVDPKAFLNFETDQYKCKSIDLQLSQATPGIMITFKEEAQVDYNITEVNHLRLLLQNQTQYENMKRTFLICTIFSQCLFISL